MDDSNGLSKFTPSLGELLSSPLRDRVPGPKRNELVNIALSLLFSTPSTMEIMVASQRTSNGMSEMLMGEVCSTILGDGVSNRVQAQVLQYCTLELKRC